jgi:putative glutamine amidotransferase
VIKRDWDLSSSPEYYKPVVGITCCADPSSGRYYLPERYVESIESAGGLPLLLPPLKLKRNIESIINKIEGLLLSGGEDLDPFFYGEEPTKGTRIIDPKKDFLEMTLTKLALKKNMPILAICRGCQVLNVAAGGTLHQDTEGLKHYQQAPRDYPTHEIEIKEGTILFEILGKKKLRVNSFHHQSVKDVAPKFVISAVAKDGVIEGIEGDDFKFVVGVQFHVEFLWKAYPIFKRTFTAFVDAVRGNS